MVRAQLQQRKNEVVNTMLMKPNQFERAYTTLDRPVATPSHPITRIVQKIEAYAEHRRQRHALMSLNDHLLKDIGLGRAEAEQLAHRPFKWFA